MGLHPKVLLYALDELFHVFRGMDANDLDGQCIVAYEILSFALLHCTEWCCKPKKCHKTCSEAYLKVHLNDVDGLEHLAWVVYDGVFLPGKPPALTGHHDWQWIIAGTTPRLICWGATAGVHCPHHAQSPRKILSKPLSDKVPHSAEVQALDHTVISCAEDPNCLICCQCVTESHLIPLHRRGTGHIIR